METVYQSISTESLLLLFGLLFLASFIDSIAGGSGLISLPAYMLTGMPVHYALGSNKFTAAGGTLIALGNYLKNGMLEWKVAAVSAVFSFLGSTVGTIAWKIALPGAVSAFWAASWDPVWPSSAVQNSSAL